MSLRAIIRNCQFRFIHSLLHPLFFFAFLLPLKLMAFITCLCSDSARGKKDRWKIFVPVYIWCLISFGLLFGLGILKNVIKDGERLNNWMTYFLIGIVSALSLLIFHWLTWGNGIFIPRNEEKLEKMYYCADIGLTNSSVPADSQKNLKDPISSDSL